MSDFPSPIRDFMMKLTLDTRLPAYLLVAHNNRLSGWGGNLAAYGMKELKKDVYVGEQVPFLEGMLPLDTSPFSLPQVTTDSGRPADVYLFEAGQGTWVLLLDATLDVRDRRRIQQKAYDLSLYVTELQRTEEELQEANEELERRVKERTAELQKTNQQLEVELAERKRTEAALRESEARFRRVAESNMIGIMFWDLNGTVTEANDAFLQALGFTRDDLLGGKIRWDDITRPELRHLDDRAIEEMRATGACTPFQRQFIRKDGKPVTLLFGAALLEGSQHKTVCFTLDLSKHK